VCDNRFSCGLVVAHCVLLAEVMSPSRRPTGMERAYIIKMSRLRSNNNNNNNNNSIKFSTHVFIALAQRQNGFFFTIIYFFSKNQHVSRRDNCDFDRDRHRQLDCEFNVFA